MFPIVRWWRNAAAFVVTPTAQADDIWLGVYQHDVTIAQTHFEDGQDLKAGWIGDPIERLEAWEGRRHMC